MKFWPRREEALSEEIQDYLDREIAENLAQGMSRHQALLRAGTTRLRPIVMTTLAMIFGMLPLAFAIGAGAEMRAPMARAVIGGLITSTLLSLVVVPVVYTFLDDFRPAAILAWVTRRKPSEKHDAVPVAADVRA